MSSVSVLLAAHGSSEDPGAFSFVSEFAERLSERTPFAQVEVGFHRQEPNLKRQLDAFRTDRIVVVPMLMSEGFFYSKIFPGLVGLDGVEPSRIHRIGAGEIVYTPAVGTHPDMVAAIEQRLRNCAGPGGLDLSETTAVLVGHGTVEHPDSTGSVEYFREVLERTGDYASVRSAFIDEPPYVGDVVDDCSTTDVAVVPYFIADGPHVLDDIPSAMGIDGLEPGDTAVPSDRRIHYTHAVGTNRLVYHVVEQRARQGLDRVDDTKNVGGATLDP